MATAKLNFQNLIFNLANWNLVSFLDKLQELAKHAFSIAVRANTEQFIYAKILPHLKKSINQDDLENGTSEKILTHFQRELKLNAGEALNELQVNTMSHYATNVFAESPKLTCHH